MGALELIYETPKIKNFTQPYKKVRQTAYKLLTNIFKILQRDGSYTSRQGGRRRPAAG